MDDWDLTGSWTVECDMLANHLSGTPAKLTMNIYRDDFRLDNPRDSNGRSEEDRYASPYDPIEEQEAANEIPPMDQPYIRRYGAVFDFEA